MRTVTDSNDTGGNPTLRLDRRTALKTVGAGLFGLGLGGTASAQEQFPPSERTDWGRPKRLGNGTIAAFLTQGRSGVPRYLGVWFTSGALDGLPEDPSSEHVVNLPLPKAAKDGTLFEYVAVGWNAQGHVPAEIYGVPHFDIHFHLLEQEAIERLMPHGECDADGDGEIESGVACEVQGRGTEPLPPRQRPPGYVSTEDTVPYMGNHWVNSNAPEFRGEPFTHTWIYGAFDGRITFVEPMITRAYLANLQGREVVSVATPDRFAEPGYYPTQYVMRRLPRQDAYAVFLRRFRRFE